MKLHQLQALVASADSGSIRAAARHLGLSQAAVT
ncbi:LysR family transcriptional regulator, partial [Serratia marcescens]